MLVTVFVIQWGNILGLTPQKPQDANKNHSKQPCFSKIHAKSTNRNASGKYDMKFKCFEHRENQLSKKMIHIKDSQNVTQIDFR